MVEAKGIKERGARTETSMGVYDPSVSDPVTFLLFSSRLSSLLISFA